ncbi:TPA: hypothetical protein L5763_14275 [Pseudomonas aeruginosa]|nr:hypothetical protein [Pseudomonas aeruginosa]HBP6448559.1 hypothetical protein [Pseudomonas aeruginosa]HBP6500462.1 hypothetical protein [Pseudomonas aeruginosa]HBP6540185.1 hypothetical protein [Pseudomonas aeruginosa]
MSACCVCLLAMGKISFFAVFRCVGREALHELIDALIYTCHEAQGGTLKENSTFGCQAVAHPVHYEYDGLTFTACSVSHLLFHLLDGVRGGLGVVAAFLLIPIAAVFFVQNVT